MLQPTGRKKNQMGALFQVEWHVFRVKKQVTVDPSVSFTEKAHIQE